MSTEKRARQKANRAAKVAQEAKTKRRRSLLKRGAIVVAVAAAIGGVAYAVTGGSHSPSASGTTTTTTKASSSTTATTASSNAQTAANKVAVAAGCPSNPKTRVNNLSWKSAPAMTIDTSKQYTAAVKTDVGTFNVSLDASKAPQTVNNFVFLANHGFYRCVIFHRVIPGFVDQTGDPTGTGTGGPGYTIPDEYPPKASNPSQQYPLGSLAMANTGQPHTGGSQWFVVAGSQGESLPPQYSLFGQVTSGMKVINRINQDGTSGGTPKVIHRILSIHITTT